MNLQQNIKHEVDLDSRRVATGLLCTIIREGVEFGLLDGLLALMKLGGSIPNWITIPPNDGVDVLAGVCFVVPKSSLDFIHDHLKLREPARKQIEMDAVARLKELELLGEGSEAALQELRQQDQNVDQLLRDTDLKVYQAVKQHIIMASVDPTLWDYQPTGKTKDVYVHSREQGQFRCELVKKNRNYGEGSKVTSKWTDSDTEEIND